MKSKQDYNYLIKRSLILAFKLDKLLNISIRPRGFGSPMSGELLQTYRYMEYRWLKKLLCECKEIEIDANEMLKFSPLPSQYDFWYEVLTDWFFPLNEKESFILRLWAKKIPIKVIIAKYEKKYGYYTSNRTVHSWISKAIDKIKCHLWQKEILAQSGMTK